MIYELFLTQNAASDSQCSRPFCHGGRHEVESSIPVEVVEDSGLFHQACDAVAASIWLTPRQVNMLEICSSCSSGNQRGVHTYELTACLYLLQDMQSGEERVCPRVRLHSGRRKEGHRLSGFALDKHSDTDKKDDGQRQDKEGIMRSKIYEKKIERGDRSKE